MTQIKQGSPLLLYPALGMFEGASRAKKVGKNSMVGAVRGGLGATAGGLTGAILGGLVGSEVLKKLPQIIKMHGQSIPNELLGGVLGLTIGGVLGAAGGSHLATKSYLKKESAHSTEKRSSKFAQFYCEAGTEAALLKLGYNEQWLARAVGAAKSRMPLAAARGAFKPPMPGVATSQALTPGGGAMRTQRLGDLSTLEGRLGARPANVPPPIPQAAVRPRNVPPPIPRAALRAN